MIISRSIHVAANGIQFSSVQSLSHVWLCATPWTAAHQASLSITNSRSLPKFMSIKSVMPSNHLILCCPLLLPPSIFPSIRVFSNESVLHIKWPKYWSFSFSMSLSKWDSQEPSPTAQFKSSNSLALSFLCSTETEISSFGKRLGTTYFTVSFSPSQNHWARALELQAWTMTSFSLNHTSSLSDH